MKLDVVTRVWQEGTVLLLVGATMGLPTTVLPALQAGAFPRPYVVAGCAAALKGVVCTALAPAAGALADHTGSRRLPLLLALALSVVPFAATLCSGQIAGGEAAAAYPVWTFTFCDAVLGLGSVSMSLCFAAVPGRLPGDEAAVTPAYSFCNFMLSTGVGIGAVIGAVSNFAQCMWAGLALTLANLAFAKGLLPMAGRGAGGGMPAQPCRSSALQWVGAVLRSNRTLTQLAAVVFLDFLAEQMLVTLLLLYLEARFHVSRLQLGAQLLVVGGCASISLLCAVPRLQPKMGDLRLMRLGLVVNVISVGLFAVIQEAWQAFIPPIGCILSFAVFPTANSLAAACVPCSQRGLAQGVISASRTLAEAASPVVFGWMLQKSAGSPLPGSPFLAAAGCVAVSWCLSLQIREPAYRHGSPIIPSCASAS